MDLSKKRKVNLEENGSPNDAVSPFQLSPEDSRKILEPFTKDQLIDIIQSAMARDPLTLSTVRSIADSDPAQRKLFVRGLGWETTTDKLQSIFSAFGEVAEAVVITDKNSGKSKGYGFVTFQHIDGALLALKEPNKKIDGRITVTQLAAAGNSGGAGAVDVSMRKIYVGNIPFEISSERLLGHFSEYGEIEEGPLGFDKQTGKAKGFAFFVYKTEEGARSSLVDPIKNIDGHQVNCKYATDGKKGRVVGNNNSNNEPVGPAGGMNSGYGGGGGYFVGGYGAQHQNMNVNSGPPGGGGYGNHQGPGQVGYGGGGGGYGGGTQYGGPGPQLGGEYGGGGGSNPGSMYRMPQGSVGGGGYPDGGNYGMPNSVFGQGQMQQPSGPRVPTGGMYQPGPYY